MLVILTAPQASGLHEESKRVLCDAAWPLLRFPNKACQVKGWSFIAVKSEEFPNEVGRWGKKI
jgi:hypothetical protein